MTSGRRKTTVVGGVFVAGALILGALYWVAPTVFDDADAIADVALRPGDAATVALGRRVYRENCAACHGAALEGQPNWRERGPDGLLPAPPHDESGHTWHHPDRLLFDLTKYGPAVVVGDPSYASDMPAYEGVLSDAEIIAALSFIKSAWSGEIAAMHDQFNARDKRE